MREIKTTTMKKEIKLDIELISDELYMMVLKELQEKAIEMGVDWNEIEDQEWNISMTYECSNQIKNN